MPVINTNDKRKYVKKLSLKEQIDIVEESSLNRSIKDALIKQLKKLRERKCTHI